MTARAAHSIRSSMAVCCVAFAGACSKHGGSLSPVALESKSAGSAQPSAAALPAASTGSKSAPSVWCAGKWTGTYRAAAHRIDLPTNLGGIPEWKVDDGKAYVGPGTIEIACADDGTVSGSLHGALGEHELRGDADDRALHARLVPLTAGSSAMSGTLTASKTGTDVTGDLSASTADGHVARTATVTLARAEP